MTQHTPEPWNYKVAEWENIYGKVYGNLAIVNAQCQEMFRSTRLLPYEEQEANAHRIVACINACAGIPTEALETGVVQEKGMGIDLADKRNRCWLGLDAPATEPLYPCADCGKLRTKAQGGTIFTVCDECWDKLDHNGLGYGWTR